MMLIAKRGTRHLVFGMPIIDLESGLLGYEPVGLTRAIMMMGRHPHWKNGLSLGTEGYHTCAEVTFRTMSEQHDLLVGQQETAGGNKHSIDSQFK